jgi:CBS domain-containing protein
MDRPQNAREQHVNALQTDDYVCISPDTPLSQAIEAMKTDEGGCVIVCANRRIVGIFTARDLLMRVVGEQVDMHSPIREWMSPVVVSLTPEATIGDAVSVMNEKGFRNVPLVRNDEVVGAISVFDIIGYLAECYPKATMNLPPEPAQVMGTVDGG